MYLSREGNSGVPHSSSNIQLATDNTTQHKQGASRAPPPMPIRRCQSGADHPLRDVPAGPSSSPRSARLSTPRTRRSTASPAAQQFSSPSQTDCHSPRHGNQPSHPFIYFFQKMPLLSAPLRLASKTKTGPTGQRDHGKKTKKTFTSTPSQHKRTHHNRTKTKPRKSRQNRQKQQKNEELLQQLPLRAALTS